MENRELNHDIMPEIATHWSPRAFDEKREVADDDLLALFEAARLAPSCFNEQPWRFIVVQGQEARQKLLPCLTERNQQWAVRAPVLMVILAKDNFSHNGKPNRWHAFDTGTAWGYLSIEAQHRGLITHAMGGFSVEQVRGAFLVPEDYSIMAVVAIGYYGQISDLPEQFLEKERPNPRKPVDEIIDRY